MIYSQEELEIIKDTYEKITLLILSEGIETKIHQLYVENQYLLRISTRATHSSIKLKKNTSFFLFIEKTSCTS